MSIVHVTAYNVTNRQSKQFESLCKRFSGDFKFTSLEMTFQKVADR